MNIEITGTPCDYNEVLFYGEKDRDGFEDLLFFVKNSDYSKLELVKLITIIGNRGLTHVHVHFVKV